MVQTGRYIHKRVSKVDIMCGPTSRGGGKVVSQAHLYAFTALNPGPSSRPVPQQLLPAPPSCASRRRSRRRSRSCASCCWTSTREERGGVHGEAGGAPAFQFSWTHACRDLSQLWRTSSGAWAGRMPNSNGGAPDGATPVVCVLPSTCSCCACARTSSQHTPTTSWPRCPLPSPLSPSCLLCCRKNPGVVRLSRALCAFAQAP